jgi:hypothetical protein
MWSERKALRVSAPLRAECAKSVLNRPEKTGILLSHASKLGDAFLSETLRLIAAPAQRTRRVRPRF